MFVVEYRTKSTFGQAYPSNFINVGPNKALSTDEAKKYVLHRLGPNVEIIDARFTASL